MPKEELPKVEKGSVLKKEDFKEVVAPDYSNTEKEYISALQSKLETAQKNRDQNHEEFDNLDFISYWKANEKGANTTIEATSNKGETQFQSGTLRTKMIGLLSSWTTLNMRAEVSAFTEQEILINNLGSSMEDIINKTQEVENDREKQVLRQYELLKQGYVFVEDLWETKWEVIKKVIKGFFGQKKGVEWSTKIKKAMGMPKRKILSGLSVYLGDMRQYFSDAQPYMFTVEYMTYDAAKELYGTWEMWEYVSKSKSSLAGTDLSMVSNTWRLLENEEGEVEVIRYQNKPANEFQIVLNGVPMLPLGFPLTEICKDGYTIVQQNLEPIRHDFAYGKSFIFKNKNLVAVLDMMMKLAVLKTKKSFLPPMLNLSQRIISRDIMMPAKITRGVRPNDLVPLSDKDSQGVTASEFNMVEKVTQFIDRNTISQTFTGSKEPGGNVTATQIRELQRQAAIMMGLMELAASLLEKKLCIKRLGLILDKWFDPIDSTVDEVRNVIKNRYRFVSQSKNIEGRGKGVRITTAMEGGATPEQSNMAAKNLEKDMRMPVELNIIDSELIKTIQLIWLITVSSKPKKSSEFSKAMFNEMVLNAANLAQMGMISPLSKDYMDRRFAEIWEEDPSKMFDRGQQGATQMGQPAPGGGQEAPQHQVKPQVNIKPQEGGQTPR